MVEYKPIWEELTLNLLDLTKKSLIVWETKSSGNSIRVFFIGDNKVEYSIKYEWTFSDEWKINDVSTLEINTTIEDKKRSINLYGFRYKSINELASILFTEYCKEFRPNNEDEIHSMVKVVTSGLSISAQRETTIEKIIKNDIHE